MAVDLKLYTDKGRKGKVGTYYQDDNGYYEVVEGDSVRSSAKTITDENGLLKEVVNDFTPISYEDGHSCLNIEKAMFNEIDYSEDFSNSSWDGSNVEKNSDTIISPRGDDTMNSIRVITDAVSENRIRTGFNAEPNRKYCVSLYVSKGVNDGYFYFRDVTRTTNQTTIIDIDNREVKSGTSVHNVSFKEEYNDKYRIEITFTTESTIFADVLDFGITSLLDTPFSSVPVGSKIYMWGIQVEKNTYASSYIPTSGTTVQRQRDNVRNIGREREGLFNSQEGVIYARIKAHSDDGTVRALSLSNGNLNGNILVAKLSYKASNEISVEYTTIGGGVELSSTAYDITEYTDIAFVYKLNDFRLYINNTLVDSETNGNVNPQGTFDRLNFSLSNGFSSRMYAKIKELTTYASIESAKRDLPYIE